MTKKKVKRTNWKLLILSGLAIWSLVQVIGFLGKESVRKEANEPKTVLTVEEREAAISTCTSEGMARSLCACIVDGMTARYSLSDLRRMNKEMETSGQSKEAVEMIRECSQPVNQI